MAKKLVRIYIREGKKLDVGLAIINIVAGIVFWNVFSILNFLVAAWCLNGAFAAETEEDNG